MPVQYVLEGTPGRIMARLQELSRITDVPGQITRTFVSPASMKAAALVRKWMEEAGMEASIDAAGNVRGRLEGSRPGLPAVMFGSHLDTVINAGAYDGTLGVLSAIEAVDRLVKAGKRPEHAVEVVGFSDEEGTRFGVTYLGSAAVAGQWDPAWFRAVDREGTSLADAMRSAGLPPENIGQAQAPKDSICAYYELHIEQGPQLETKDRSLAAVTCISRCRRFSVTVTGKTGHAGTVPVSWRQDAMLGACAVIGAMEEVSRKYGDTLFCTVGTIACRPNMTNSIAERVDFHLDIRSQDPAEVESALGEMRRKAEDICRKRGLGFSASQFFETRLTVCDPGLTSRVRDAIGAVQPDVPELPSGAGQDAAEMAMVWPVAMIFLRSKGAVSHCPEEDVWPDDVETGIRCLTGILSTY